MHGGGGGGGGGGYSFITDGYGIFNMRTHWGAYSTQEGGGVGVRRKQVCTRVLRNLLP